MSAMRAVHLVAGHDNVGRSAIGEHWSSSQPTPVQLSYINASQQARKATSDSSSVSCYKMTPVTPLLLIFICAVGLQGKKMI